MSQSTSESGTFTTSDFTKSDRSGYGGCVEVARAPELAAIRDSKHPEHGHLGFAAREWAAFLAAAKCGEL